MLSVLSEPTLVVNGGTVDGEVRFLVIGCDCLCVKRHVEVLHGKTMKDGRT